jgi:hypothetical protein
MPGGIGSPPASMHRLAVAEFADWHASMQALIRAAQAESTDVGDDESTGR